MPLLKAPSRTYFIAASLERLLRAQEAGQDVETERHGFQAEEQNEQGRLPEAMNIMPMQARQKQRVIFAFLFVLQIQVADGKQNHESRGGKKEHGEDDEEAIDDDGVMKTEKSWRPHGFGAAR